MSMNRLINISSITFLLAGMVSCNNPAKSQVEQKLEEVVIDSSGVQVADSLLSSLSNHYFEKAKLLCENECALGYFLQQKFDEITNYKIALVEHKKGLDLISIHINDRPEIYRLVFFKNKFVFLWPQRHLIWYDCMPDPVVWDMIFQISEEEKR